MSGAPVPARRIAAALRETPVYVDPRLARDLPEPRRERLRREMAKAADPVYLLIVPIKKIEGEWADGEQLANSVHAHLDAAGTYVTLDDAFEGDLDAYAFGLDETRTRLSEDAARAANLERDLRDAELADRLERCVQLIANGQGSAAYRKATAGISGRPATRRTGGPAGGAAGPGGDGFPVLPVTAGGAAVLGAVGGLLWLRRRRERVAPDPHLQPRKVLRAARRAGLRKLRETAAAETVALGELVGEAPVDGAGAAHVQRALDAYQAAGQALEAARDLPDYAGVLVLADMGRDALDAAGAAAEGRRPVRPSPLCFFNPLHGDAVRTVSWRPLGQRRRLKVPVCGQCRTDLSRHRLPDTLPHRSGGRDVPYYEVSAGRSVWAATGYGALADDLIERVLRGDLRRAAGGDASAAD